MTPYSLQPDLDVVEAGPTVYLVRGGDTRRPQIVLSLTADEFAAVFAAPAPRRAKLVTKAKRKPTGKTGRRGPAERKRRPRITEEDKAKLRDLYDQGVPAAQAAERVGCNLSTAYKFWGDWKAATKATARTPNRLPPAKPAPAGPRATVKHRCPACQELTMGDPCGHCGKPNPDAPSAEA